MKPNNLNPDSDRNPGEQSFTPEAINDAKGHLNNFTITENPDSAGYIREMALATNAWKWQMLWLKHCLSARTELLFCNMEKEGQESNREEPIDRESDINRILHEKSFLTPLKGRTLKYYNRGIAGWFLRRYNWLDAYSVYCSQPRDHARKHYFARIAFVVVSLLLITVALISLYHQNPISYPWLEIGLGALLIVIAVETLRRPRFVFIRLMVTIIVGFALVTVEDSLWKFAVTIDWRMLATVSSLAFAAGLVYGSAECAKASSLGQFRALRRALPVILWGILFALVTGAVISYVIGSFMLRGFEVETIISYTGLRGTIYPGVVFLFAPVSLFIGLFINSFWQEKTITDPF